MTQQAFTSDNGFSTSGNVSTPTVYSNGMAVEGYDFVQMQYSNAVALPVSPYDIGTGSWFFLDPAGATWESNTTGTLNTVVLGNDGSVSAVGSITGGNVIMPGSGGDMTMTGGNITGAVRVITTPVALSSLTTVAGGRAFVNDGNLVAASNFGSQIGSGGSNVVPVWSDGANWYIG